MKSWVLIDPVFRLGVTYVGKLITSSGGGMNPPVYVAFCSLAYLWLVVDAYKEGKEDVFEDLPCTLDTFE